jgi:hypothetical protein
VTSDSILVLLLDPVWQFVGAILAVTALLSSYSIYLAQRPRKRVTYQRLASIPLLTVKEELAGRLSVIFDGKPAKMIRTTTLRIQNAGNLPIVSADFVEPVWIRAEVDAKIIAADVVDANPPSLRPVLSVAEYGAKLEPLLLNAGDSFVVKLLVQDGSEFAFLTGRVVGVRAFERVNDPDRKLDLITLLGMSLCLLGQASYLAFSPERPSIDRTPIEYLALTLTISGLVIWGGVRPAVVIRRWWQTRADRKSGKSTQSR